MAIKPCTRRWRLEFWGDFMLERLKALLDIADINQDGLLSALLAEAESAALCYTRRTQLPSELESTVVRLALIAYNRRGTEGEAAHSEGGVDRTYDSGLPKDIQKILNRYIKARVV